MSNLSQKMLMAAAGGSELQPNIEDVFHIDVYAGDHNSSSAGSDRSMPLNNVNISDHGGMIWSRGTGFHTTSIGSLNAAPECWFDTERGADKALYVSESNKIEKTLANSMDFSTAGPLIGRPAGDASNYNYPEDDDGTVVRFNYGNARAYNQTQNVYNVHTFRKHPKFFDVQKVSHDSSSSTTVNLNLENPGFVVVAGLASGDPRWAWHRSFDAGKLAKISAVDYPATSAMFTVSGNSVTLSTNYATGDYTIAAWNHDTSSSGLVQCFGLDVQSGTWPTGTHPYYDLGWYPQWVLQKRNDTTNEYWGLTDKMYQFYAWEGGHGRDITNGIAGYNNNYTPDFNFYNGGKKFYGSFTKRVYVAIRNGPMAAPTAGTQVYYGQNSTNPGFSNGQSLDSWSNYKTTFFTGWPVDFGITRLDSTATSGTSGQNGLTYRNLGDGAGYAINQVTESRPAAGSSGNSTFQSPTGLGDGYATYGSQFWNWMFRAYPGFLDNTFYRGDGTANRNIEHNLGVVPELIIFMPENSANSAGNVNGVGIWHPWLKDNGRVTALSGDVSNGASWVGAVSWGSYPSPTSSVFTVGSDWNNMISYTGGGFSTSGWANNAGQNRSNVGYIATSFATVEGVSKVGTFSHVYGVGATTDVDCGFTSGARFVLIREVTNDDSVTNIRWYMFNTALGIVAGNDSYLYTNFDNSTIQTGDLIDSLNAGFTWNYNGSGTRTYLFLAIA